MIDSIKLEIKNKLEAYYKEKYNVDLQIVVEEPKKAELGDISVPMFAVVKTLRKPMPEIVSEALEAIKSFNLPISDIKSVGAFDTTAVSGNYATGANTTANSPVEPK